MWRDTKYISHKNYILSNEWREKRYRIKKNYPRSYYCFVCDCTKILDLHHEGYETVPHEKFLVDLFWLCSERCPCRNDCHFRVQKGISGLLYEKYILKAKRLQLRREFLLKHLRPSTALFYMKRFFYRMFY